MVEFLRRVHETENAPSHEIVEFDRGRHVNGHAPRDVLHDAQVMNDDGVTRRFVVVILVPFPERRFAVQDLRGHGAFFPPVLPQILDALFGTDNLGNAQTELFVDHHHVATGNQTIVHQKFDGFVDKLADFDNRSGAER